MECLHVNYNMRAWDAMIVRLQNGICAVVFRRSKLTNSSASPKPLGIPALNIFPLKAS